MISLSRYTALEKQMIMLYGDLLAGSLSNEERNSLEMLNLDVLITAESLASSDLDCNLKSKVSDLLSQGIKLSVELEKLSQRGICIVFTGEEKVSDSLLKKFFFKPTLLFKLGNDDLIGDDSVQVVTSYQQFRITSDPVIFIPDLRFDTVMTYSDVAERVQAGDVVLASDYYRRRSNNLIKDSIRRPKESQAQKKIFISGSRSQFEIPIEIQKSLELIKEKHFEILIGDSEKGVDNEIIDYLRVPKYSEITVFTIKKSPRVSIEPEWSVRLIKSDDSLKVQERQMVKDRAMAEEADMGLAVFNPISKNRYGSIQVSSGTLRNTIQMLLSNKPVKFFFLYGGNLEYRDLKSINDLRFIIDSYRSEDLTEKESSIIASSRGVASDANLAHIKHQKILKKYNELLKKEDQGLHVQKSLF